MCVAAGLAKAKGVDSVINSKTFFNFLSEHVTEVHASEYRIGWLAPAEGTKRVSSSEVGIGAIAAQAVSFASAGIGKFSKNSH
jgi:hypothetical protein